MHARDAEMGDVGVDVNRESSGCAERMMRWEMWMWIERAVDVGKV